MTIRNVERAKESERERQSGRQTKCIGGMRGWEEHL